MKDIFNFSRLFFLIENSCCIFITFSVVSYQYKGQMLKINKNLVISENTNNKFVFFHLQILKTIYVVARIFYKI